MHLTDVEILRNEAISGGYYLLEMSAADIASAVDPGQFVHLRLHRKNELVLRRPFSVFKAEDGRLSILYKNVGQGTAAMTLMKQGDTVSLIGPLGHGYPPAGKNGRVPVLVAGGYGMAALYLVAQRSSVEGVAFFGGASSRDILCVEEFQDLGWQVQVATEDGSRGNQGLVTDLLDAWLLRDAASETEPEFFACGPLGMLKAVGERAQQRKLTAWLSMDRNMGCGVGACLTCVQRVRGDSGDWKWARICKEGPVFECRDIMWDMDESE